MQRKWWCLRIGRSASVSLSICVCCNWFQAHLDPDYSGGEINCLDVSSYSEKSRPDSLALAGLTQAGPGTSLSMDRWLDERQLRSVAQP